MDSRRLLVALLLICAASSVGLSLLPASGTGGGGGTSPWKQVLLTTSAATGTLQLCWTQTTLVSQTITTSGGLVHVLASGKMMDGNSNYAYASIYRGSTQLAYEAVPGPIANMNGSMLVIDNPPAGTYTYSLQACASANATGSIYGPSAIEVAEHS